MEKVGECEENKHHSITLLLLKVQLEYFKIVEQAGRRKRKAAL